MEKKKIGNFISEMRKQEKMTQKELAERLNVTDKAISRWETGKGIPDIVSLQELSSCFKVSINEILCGEKVADTDIRNTADQIMIGVLKKEKKTRRRWIIGCVTAACLLTVIVLTKIPVMGVSAIMSLSSDTVDEVFDYVQELEEKGRKYSVALDSESRTISIVYE